MLLLLLTAASWESPRVPPGQEVLPGLTGLRAEDCGACHVEFYEEWKASTHAHAWTDAQFQGELHKDPEVAWLCINCHTPAGDQQEELAVATGEVRHPERSANADFSAEWQQEGITCVSCHLVDDAIAGPFGDTSAPHPTVKDERLTDERICLECHQAVQRVEDTLVCTFNTGEEWAEAGIDQPCQSCHMPEVTRGLVPGMQPERPTRRHLWIGSKIPKDRIEPGEQAWYDLFEHGLDARVELDGAWGQMVLTNARAGHLLPTGDPERYVMVTATVYDEQGVLLSRTGYRIGQRWTWWPVAEKTGDNRLAPAETRRVTFPVPEGASQVHLFAEHYRISPENAAYHGLDDDHIKAQVLDVRLPVE